MAIEKTWNGYTTEDGYDADDVGDEYGFEWIDVLPIDNECMCSQCFQYDEDTE